MTEDEFVAWATGLDDYVWQLYTTQVMWFHRKGASDVSLLPDDVVLAGRVVTDQGEWERVRRRIASERKSRRRQALAAWRVASAERRRDYMREYMRRYRKES